MMASTSFDIDRYVATRKLVETRPVLFALWRTIAIVLLIALDTPTAMGQSVSASIAPPTDVQALIEKLGSNQFAEREAATLKLIANESARIHVEKLSRSKDAEIATRAQRILADHDRIYASTRLGRFFRYGKEGQVERMVEGLARWSGPIESAEIWQGLRDVGGEVFEKVTKKGARPHLNDFRYWHEKTNTKPVYRRLTEPWTGHLQNGGFFIIDIQTKAGHFNNLGAISTGPISVSGGTASGILFTTDDFDSGDADNSRVAGFVIVSAGRVTLRRRVEDSLIVARHGIELKGVSKLGISQLFSSAKIEGAQGFAGTRDVVIVPSESRPLGLIQWFETRTIGFDVVIEKGRPKVNSVAEGSVAALAGLRAGDEITAVDGNPVKDAIEEFRKQLRRGSIQDACELTLLRSGKTERIDLDFRSDNKK